MKPLTTMVILVVVILVISMTSLGAPTPVRRSSGLVGATREMERANYFTFVMLINMCPPSLFPPNVTFLMPNDRLLASADVGVSVPEFLLRHSIPSPLLFDTLRLLPSGSVLPSGHPAYSLTVANAGRRSYLINNVRLVSPNICSNATSTVRCHGIDGVLPPETANHSAPACASRAENPSPSPSPGYEYVGAAPASQGSPVMMPPPATKDSSGSTGNETVAVVPSPAVSGGGGRVVVMRGVVVLVVSMVMLLV